MLVHIPQFEALTTTEEFVDKQNQVIAQVLPSIQVRNREIETAVEDLVALLTGSLTAVQQEQMQPVWSAFGVCFSLKSCQ